MQFTSVALLVIKLARSFGLLRPIRFSPTLWQSKQLFSVRARCIATIFGFLLWHTVQRYAAEAVCAESAIARNTIIPSALIFPPIAGYAGT